MKTVAVEHSSPKQAKVYKIEWNLGKRCNFHCSYCDEFTHDNKSEHLSFEVAKNTVDKILEKTQGRRVKINLTGGEPAVNPNIEQIIDYMYQSGIEVGMTTNGSRKLEFYKNLVPKMASILFSYHMEYHKRDVLPENIVELQKFINTLDKHVHLHVHIMMLPTRFDEAKNVIEYFRDNNVNVIMRRIRPAYKRNENAKYNEKGHLVEGEIARPFYSGISTLKMINGQPDYSDEQNYYSEEELEFLRNNNV